MLTNKQIQARKSGLFGTDASAIEGTNEFLGQHELYHIKRGTVNDDVIANLAMNLGHDCEPSNIKQVGKALGKKVRGSNCTVWSKKHLCPDGNQFLGAHLDGKVVGERTIIECKNVHYRGEAKWGKPGSDEIPPNYRSQVKHYCLVTGMRKVVVGAIFLSWPQHHLFHIEFSEKEINDLYELEWGFWGKVRQGIEPPVDSTKGCASAIKRRWPRVIDVMDITQTNAEIDKSLDEMKKNKEEMKKLEDEETRLTNDIRRKMEDRPLLVTPEGNTVASYKENKNGVRTLRFIK